jgi:NADP-dependent 3-hydroxy acid dehydrogenase YdfG
MSDRGTGILPGTLEDRIAVVIGATGGIGEHTARALADAGASVALLARRAERLDRIAFEIEQSGGRALVFPVDITDPLAIERVGDRVRTEMGSAGILVTNAGLGGSSPARFLHQRDWARQVDVNVAATTFAIGVFVDHLLAAGRDQGVADLVTIASMSAAAPVAGFSVLEATKAYVLTLSDNLRVELGPSGVRVTTVVPDDVLDGVRPEGELEPPVLTEDVAEVITFAVGLPPRVSLRQISVRSTAHPSPAGPSAS